MGTRSDFYVGKGENVEWLGSVGFDGYPSGIDRAILTATNETAYREAITAFFASIDHATLPEQGWPWPWDSSATSDYAYTFADGSTWYTVGSPDRWIKATEPKLDEDAPGYDELITGLELAAHPDMSARKNVRWDKGSGLMIVKLGGSTDQSTF